MAFNIFKRNKSTPARSSKRSYFKGASFSKILQWIVAPLAADKELRSDLDKLRARSRELQRNNPLVRQYLSLAETNIIGPQGIKLQAQLTQGNGLPAKKVNDTIEAAWTDWSRSVTADGRLTLTQFMQLLARTLPIDGEVLVRMVFAPLNRFGFALQLLDIDQLDTDYNEPAHTDRNGRRQNEVRLGVEVDEWGRPVAYHVFEHHASDDNSGKRKRMRLPAQEVLHVYSPDRASQNRGVPWLNSVMVPLKMFDGYIEAELVASRAAAAKMGFLKYTDAASLQLEADIPMPDELSFDAAPGTIEVLPPGVEFQEWNPSHPTNAFDSFARGILRQIASGLQVSYPSLTGDLSGVNFSSIRAGILIERDRWRVLQTLFIERLYRPIYEAWLAQSLLVGALTLRSQNPADYHTVKWLPRRWEWVDPLKDINASILAIQHGLASRKTIAAELGRDFEEIIEDLAHEKQLADAAGLTLGATPNMQAVADLQQEDGPADAADEQQKEMVTNE